MSKNNLSGLQEIVLSILDEHSKGELFRRDCTLTNQQIFDLIRPKTMRPYDCKYISNVISDLQKKGKIKKKTSHVGSMGHVRTVTIL